VIMTGLYCMEAREGMYYSIVKSIVKERTKTGRSRAQSVFHLSISSALRPRVWATGRKGLTPWALLYPSMLLGGLAGADSGRE
jgi:hypothetical protein